MSIEAMKQALEALEGADSIIWSIRGITPDDICEAITSLRQAIEQYEKQKPVGTLNIWFYKGHGNYDFEYWGSLGEGTYAVYTTPPAAQRQWVDMPELELLGAYEEEQQGRWGDHVRGLLNVQAKLKELNHVN